MVIKPAETPTPNVSIVHGKSLQEMLRKGNARQEKYKTTAQSGFLKLATSCGIQTHNTCTN